MVQMRRLRHKDVAPFAASWFKCEPEPRFSDNEPARHFDMYIRADYILHSALAILQSSCHSSHQATTALGNEIHPTCACIALESRYCRCTFGADYFRLRFQLIGV